MIDVIVNKALLHEIDRMLSEMQVEFEDMGLSPKTYTREQVDPAKLDTVDLSFARNDIESIYVFYESVKLVRSRHAPETWKNFKVFRVTGLTEQKLLKEKQDLLKKAFLDSRPSLLFKLKAGSDGNKRKK